VNASQARVLTEHFEGRRVSVRARIEDEFGRVETYWGKLDGMGTAEVEPGKDGEHLLLTQGGGNRQVQLWLPVEIIEAVEIEFS
jgi:hypothetical protein